MQGLFPPSSFRLHPFQFRRLWMRLDVNRVGELERRNALRPDARLFALGLVPERLQYFVGRDGDLVHPHAAWAAAGGTGSRRPCPASFAPNGPPGSGRSTMMVSISGVSSVVGLLYSSIEGILC